MAALAAASALAGCGATATGPRATNPTTTTTTTAPGHAQPQATTLPDRAAQQAAVKHFIREGRPISCGAGRKRLVALTFDDGPGRYTPIMLRQLRAAGAHATFFLVGRSIQRFPRTPALEREQAAIGEHTMTHADLSTLSRAAARAEIAQGKAMALHAAGPPIELFRPPYGRHDAAIDREVRRQGMAEILWSVDSTDSRVSPPADFHEISAHVRAHARPGSIVLMHENRGQTIRAVRSILPALKRRHLRLVTVPELLAADPPSAAQLKAGLKGCQPTAGPTAASR